MFKILTLAALVACVYAVQAPCPGCAYEDTSNEDVRPQLILVLKQVGLDEQVKSVDKVTKQVTGGVYYEVEFTSVSGKACKATWLSRPWESKMPLDAAASCK